MRGPDRLGFREVGQRGSHVKLRRGSVTVIVPDHRDVRKGTLAAILKQAGVTADDFTAALTH